MPVNVSVVVSHDGVQRHTQLFVGYRPGAPLGTLQWRDEEDIRSFFVQCDNIRAELAIVVRPFNAVISVGVNQGISPFQ